MTLKAALRQQIIHVRQVPPNAGFLQQMRKQEKDRLEEGTPVDDAES